MNKLFPFRIECSVSTLVVWGSILLLGSPKYILFCYGIMLMHELSHVFVASIQGCHVQSVKIYPFGFCAEIEQTDHLSALECLILYSAGAFAHLFIWLILSILVKSELVSIAAGSYYMKINLHYLYFNLLPVYPLDGYQFVKTLLFCFFPLRTAEIISMLFSFVFLFVFLDLMESTIVIKICGFLLLVINLTTCIRLKTHWFHFYMQRLFNNRQKKVKVHSFCDLFVYRNNIFLGQHQLLDEKMLIKKILKLK